MSEGTLILRDLRSGYESPSLPALTAELVPGQHLVIRGPSGCGKSSLLKVICGLCPPASGEILWQTQAVTAQTLPWWRTQINYLPQEPVMGGTTIEDVLLLPWAMQATRLNKPKEAQCDTVLDELGLTHTLDTDVSQLSGGEKQRLAFARALLLERPIWLMDEPTSALDPDNRDMALALLKDNGRIAISVSHDPVWIAAADETFDMGGENE